MEKRILIKIFFILSFVVGVFADGPTVTDLNISSQDGNAVLTWSASGESSQQEFIVQRKPNNQTTYDNIATVPANGSGHYSYVDRSIYKTTGDFYNYQILLVDVNNTNYIIASTSSGVSMNISGVKRTWGSIKAMFR